MKPLNSATALLIAATLVAGVTGCKHAPPKPPTPIPGRSVTDVPPADGLKGPVGNPNTNKSGPGTGDQVPRSNTLTDNTNPNTTGLNNLDPSKNGDVKSKPLNPEEAAKLSDRPPLGEEDPVTLKAETVYFEFDRSTVKPSELPKVQRVAAYLKSNASANLRVEGNCDERGTEEYNRSLGERRALAIRELLVAEGIDPKRVTTLSYGEDKPADPGHDDVAWGKNRRGDFVVLKAASIQ